LNPANVAANKPSLDNLPPLEPLPEGANGPETARNTELYKRRVKLNDQIGIFRGALIQAIGEANLPNGDASGMTISDLIDCLYSYATFTQSDIEALDLKHTQVHPKDSNFRVILSDYSRDFQQLERQGQAINTSQQISRMKTAISLSSRHSAALVFYENQVLLRNRTFQDAFQSVMTNFINFPAIDFPTVASTGYIHHDNQPSTAAAAIKPSPSVTKISNRKVTGTPLTKQFPDQDGKMITKYWCQFHSDAGKPGWCNHSSDRCRDYRPGK